MSTDYDRLTVERHGPVGTIAIRAWWRDDDGVDDLMSPLTGNLHWEVADAVEELRRDNEVRVIVLTGTGDAFQIPPSGLYHSDAGRAHRNDPRRIWLVFEGVIRAHMAMAECEKPIVGRINGDAIGYGMSLALACDVIVAVEDARIVDHHMGMGEVEGVGAEYGFVTGDGGSALVPLYLPPALAKEFLMLARPFTAAELEARSVINYAVPADELDDTVVELVERLLERSAYALAWTKRTANRRVVDHLNKTLDAAAAYEMVNFLQLEWLEWRDPKRLVWEDGEDFETVEWDGTF